VILRKGIGTSNALSSLPSVFFSPRQIGSGLEKLLYFALITIIITVHNFQLQLQWNS